MNKAEIKATVDKLADVARVLPEADPADKAEVFRQLGLKLPYHQADGSSKRPSSLCGMGFSTVSEGDSQLTYMTPITLTAEFELDVGGKR